MDISAHVAGMTQTTNDLQTKIEAVDAEILKLKQQYRVSNPSQQGQMKLRMQQLLASKKRYEQQRGATYARLGNMEQSECARRILLSEEWPRCFFFIYPPTHTQLTLFSQCPLHSKMPK